MNRTHTYTDQISLNEKLLLSAALNDTVTCAFSPRQHTTPLVELKGELKVSLFIQELDPRGHFSILFHLKGTKLRWVDAIGRYRVPADWLTAQMCIILSWRD